MIGLAPLRTTGAPLVTALDCRAYEVPTSLPEADGTLAWTSTSAVVVQVTAGGMTGLGWTYASPACVAVIDSELRHVVEGSDPLHLVHTWEAMQRQCRNLGTRGVVACAMSAVDVALWDLKAKLLGVPLTGLLGQCRDSVPVYGSGGFTTYDDATLAAQVHHFVADLGVCMVKIKIGGSCGSAVQRDIERAAVARAAGDGAALFVDANGAYTRKQAVRVGRELVEELGVVWFEEPVSSDDLDGLRVVRDQVTADVTAGEYGYDTGYFERMASAGSVDCLQVDATRCGGYTGWLRAAAVADVHGLDVSAHCAPNLHAPVAAAVPNLRHIEYFHDHARLDPMLFDGVGEPRLGMLAPSAELGHGMTLKTTDADMYRIR